MTKRPCLKIMALLVLMIVCACILNLEIVVAFDNNDRFGQRLEKAYFDVGYTYNLILVSLLVFMV